MAAQDNLSPQQFFHGSYTEFGDGDLIDPSQPHAMSFPDNSDPAKAYFTNSASNAHLWAARADAKPITQRPPVVYQVATTGDYTHDSHYARAYARGELDPAGVGVNFETRSPLRVVRRLAPEEVK
jgi:hypothetical protein